MMKKELTIIERGKKWEYRDYILELASGKHKIVIQDKKYKEITYLDAPQQPVTNPNPIDAQKAAETLSCKIDSLIESGKL